MTFREKAVFNFLKLKHRFVGRHPISTKLDANHLPFFIMSSGRSGTTLLRTMLIRGEHVVIPPESNILIPEVVTIYLKKNRKSWEDLVSAIFEHISGIDYLDYWDLDINKIVNHLMQLELKHRSLHAIIEAIYTNGSSSRIRWGDKTPIVIFMDDYITYAFPKAKRIYMIRDGRDVIRSRIEHRNDATLHNSIERWNNACDIIQRRIGENSHFNMVIRYEDLVTEPEIWMKKICVYLGLDYHPQMLNASIKLDLGDTVMQHHENSKRPISTESIGKWKAYFNDQDIRHLNQALGTNLQRFNYAI